MVKFAPEYAPAANVTVLVVVTLGPGKLPGEKFVFVIETGFGVEIDPRDQFSLPAPSIFTLCDPV
jgi:hypothetical protein